MLCKSSFIQNHHQRITDCYIFYNKELGHGGFGTVFKAHPKENPKITRAIKRIPKNLGSRCPPVHIEIDNLKTLDHPGITRLYETFEDAKYTYLVMEYLRFYPSLCEGNELFDRLDQEGNFSESDARKVFRQMVETVNYCHSQKIAHRDLKPENFLFLEKQSLSIKLIDFGFSYLWKESMEKQLKEIKQNKKIVGSAYYISPELIAGKYDQRTDLWSLGVILYILVSGLPPFDGQTDSDIFKSIIKGNFDFNLPEFSNVSSSCKDLISKILQPLKKRISFLQIFEHPWLKFDEKQLNRKPLKINFSRIKNFTKFNKIKTIAATYIASQLPEKQIQELGQLFKQLDINHDGFISVQQLQLGLNQQNQSTTLIELKKIIEFIDTDHNGKIDYTEFIACTLDKEVLEDKENLISVFKMLDKDGNGTVDREELKELLMNKNTMNSSEKESSIDQIIKQCDTNGDGKIDFDEFMQSMSNA